MLNLNTVLEMSVREIIDELHDQIFSEVPEESLSNPDSLAEVDTLLARMANLHTFVVALYGVVSEHAMLHKELGNMSEYHLQTRKKDALYELSRSLRYKQEACSRKLTIQTMEDEDLFDSPDYQGRKERAKGKKEKMKSWKSV